MRERINHLLTHCNKEVIIKLTITNKVIYTFITKTLTLMSPAKETKFGITFGEIYLTISLLFTMVVAVGGVWLNVNTRLTALEEGRKNNSDNIIMLRLDNNEAHIALMQGIKDNQKETNENNKLLNQIAGKLGVN